MEVSRTRKFASLSSATVQAYPHASSGPPKVAVCSEVVAVVSVFAVVQEVSPSQESSTLMLLVPSVLSSHQSRRTSMPLTEQPEGIEML